MRLRFSAGSEFLVGTLELPPDAGPFPSVLIVNGSGPIDRDSNMPGQELHIADSLAAAFAAAGLASMRYDKRGVGESTGDYLTTGFFDETEDARGALHALRDHPTIDGVRVLVAGHSVGATIAGRVAATESLAGCILLAGAAEDGKTGMERQSESIAAAMTGMARLRKRHFLRVQDHYRGRLEHSASDVIKIDGDELPAGWFREYMAYDPRADLRRVECPVLAITGAHDVQVVPADVHQICRLVAGPSTPWSAPGITHLLRKGRAGLSHYASTMAQPVDADLLRVIVEWSEDVASQ